MPDNATTCPTWCRIEDHDNEYGVRHESAVESFISERKVLGEHRLIKVYAEQHHIEGQTFPPAVVIDGQVSECLNLAEFSLADARRVVEAMRTALALVGEEVPA